MDTEGDTTRKAGAINGTKSFTASRAEERKRQLKRKFFLFITLKNTSRAYKILPANSSFACSPRSINSTNYNIFLRLYVLLSLPLLRQLYKRKNARRKHGTKLLCRLEFYDIFLCVCFCCFLSFLFIAVYSRKSVYELWPFLVLHRELPMNFLPKA